VVREQRVDIAVEAVEMAVEEVGKSFRLVALCS